MKKNQRALLFLVSLISILGINNTTKAQWQELNTPEYEYRVMDLFQEQDTLYAICENKIYKSYNSGDNWNRFDFVNPVFPFTLINAFEHLDSTFIIYSDSGINISNNYGNTWSNLNIFPYSEINSFTFDSNNIYAACDNGLYKLDYNNGFFIKADTFSNLRLSHINIDDSTIVCDISNGFIISYDYGSTWVSSYLSEYGQNYNLVKCQTNYYAISNLRFYKSSDQGLNWVDITNLLPSSNLMYCNIFTEDDILYFNSKDSVLHKSTDGGNTWSHINDGLILGGWHNPMQDIYKENDTLYASFLNGGIFKSVNDGLNWEPKNTGMQKANGRIHCIGDTLITNLYGTGIYLSMDYGQNWECINSGSLLNLRMLYTDNNSIYISDLLGAAVSNDYGNTWQRILLSDSMGGIAAKDNLIVCGKGQNGLMISHDYGVSWTTKRLVSQFSMNVGRIIINDNEIFVDAYGIFYSNDYGNNFTNITQNMYPYIDEMVYDGSNLFLTTQIGILHSSDKGSNWDTIYISDSTWSIYYYGIKIIDDYLFVSSIDNPIVYCKIGVYDWVSYTDTINHSNCLNGAGYFFDASDNYLYASGTTGIYRRPLLDGVGLIDNYLFKSNILVYPNPTTDVLNISLDWETVDINSIKQVKVYNLQGQEIKTFYPAKTLSEISINCAGLRPGMYIVSINAGDKVYSQRFIKE